MPKLLSRGRLKSVKILRKKSTIFLRDRVPSGQSGSANVKNLGFRMCILNKLGTDERTSELSHLRTNELLATSPVVTLYQRSLSVFGTTASNRVGVLLTLRNATNSNALELG